MPYTFKPSPHKSSRRGCSISAIILHFTANATLAACVRWFQSPSSKVSAHYVIGRDGQVVQMVQEHEKAWHAGMASLDGDPYVNSMSIGIELVNWGELRHEDEQYYCWPDDFKRPYDVAKYGAPREFFKTVDDKRVPTYWAPYTSEQEEALVDLCREIMERHPEITPERIVGHEDVAPGRKNDPGPALGIEKLRARLSALPNELYAEPDEDDPSEEQLAKRQEDRAEPLTWYQRVMARLNEFRRQRQAS